MESNRKPILSLCIPTNGILKWVIPTLESIYTQNVDNNLFEVIITDNGQDSELQEALSLYNYPNLSYIKTNDSGFLNLVTCLEKGHGLFCKMINHRMMIRPGMLQQMIDIVLRYKDEKPVMYFVNGMIKLPIIQECTNFDSFVYNLHYCVSWSAGIGFWDIDIENLSSIVPNQMFPNTSLLFEHRINSHYVIWNGIYGEMQNDDGKGGYDLFNTFAVVLPDIVWKCKKQKRIKNRTWSFFKRKLFFYLCNLYYEEVVMTSKRTFEIKNVRESICKYYSMLGYLFLVFYCYTIKPLRKIGKQIIKK